MASQVNDVIRVPCTIDDNFFKFFFTIMKPYHGLSSREIDVLSLLVRKRYYLSKVISDPKILDKVVMDEDTRKEIREQLGMSSQHLLVILNKLKANGILKDGKINPKFIPSLKEGQNNYQLLFLFDFDQK